MSEVFMPQGVGVPQNVHGSDPMRRGVRGRGLRRRPFDRFAFWRGVAITLGVLALAGAAFVAGRASVRAPEPDLWGAYVERALAECGTDTAAEWHEQTLDVDTLGTGALQSGSFGDSLTFDTAGTDGRGPGVEEDAWCLLDAADIPRAVAARVDQPTTAVSGDQATWGAFHLMWWHTDERGLDFELIPADA